MWGARMGARGFGGAVRVHSSRPPFPYQHGLGLMARSKQVGRDWCITAPAVRQVGKKFFSDSATATRSSTSKRDLILYGGAGAVAGVLLLGIMADGSSKSSSVVVDHPQTMYSTTARKRISATYAYLAGGIGYTAAAATAMFRSGIAYKMMQMNPWLLLGGSLVATIGTMIGTQAIPYNNTIPKHLMWLGFNTCIAASLAPMGVLGGPLVLKAATITGCVVGGLSLTAACAPSETWLQMRGPLSIGLGVVIASSFGQLLFPASSMLYNIGLYGGLAVFGGFVLYDTAKIRRAAEVVPAGHYDPVNFSIGVYMDSVNIFVRVAQILAMNQGRRK
eukprot:CAMPEP_0119131684 /NCGR_PEP_ID=MMETSP1310-20130426/10520_1 /TAXON_ID=464262 /ORGANISM="Genus nov. species nov., Strain RCC2339" /LENGTH=332 /DNA_ID=CAMNT_0007122275 /DNA_START=106 /DNA_END=1104 /DNA_ORIENTATION=-